MTRRRTVLMAAVATAGLPALTACAANTTESAASDGGGAESDGGSGAGTRTITDHAGVEVVLPARITRVAVDEIPIASTYLAYFQGSAPHLIGMSGSVVNALRGTVAAQMAPDILSVDTSYFDDGELNVETLLTLEPDVVLFNASNDEHRKMFAAAGIPAVGFATDGDPTTVYTDWLRLLEQVFGEPGKMDDTIAYGEKIVADAKARNAQAQDAGDTDVLIVFMYSSGTFRVAGEAEFFGSFWLQAAGARNAAVGTTTGLAPVTAEQILAWEPDTVLIGGAGQAQLTPDQVLDGGIDGADLTALTAVRDRRVYSNGLGMWSWFTPNPDAPLIATWIGQAVHPDLADAAGLRDLTVEYYSTVYGFDLTEEQVSQIYAASFA